MLAIHSGWVANWGFAQHAAHHITTFSYFSHWRPDCHKVWNVQTLAEEGGGGKAGIWAEHT